MLRSRCGIATFVLIVMFISACTATGEPKPETSARTVATEAKTAPVATKESYEMAMAAARDAQMRADSVGGEWRDVQKFLKQAELTAENGDYAKAIKLADKAKFQSEMGYKQAIDQMKAGPRF
jgi:hypothetical protein